MEIKLLLCVITVALSVAVTKGQNFASLEACRSELGISDPSRFTCLIGCVGKKDGWLNGDGTLNVDKNIAVLSQLGMPASDVAKLRTAADICKNVGRGMSDPCKLGDKLFNCMIQNGAPRPPMLPIN